MKKLIIPSKLNEGDTIAFFQFQAAVPGMRIWSPDICWASGDSKKSFM